jgi:cysteine desulfurase / selenocysteine lyase
VPHMAVDVQALDCDFYAFSGHKMYGPTGVGVLYGRESLLEEMHPWQGGGEMIREVSFEHTEYNVLPHKFEAGTPNISGAVGMAAAIHFINGIGVDNVASHEADVLRHATALALERPWFRIIGNAHHKAGVLAFSIDGAHPNDIGMMLDADGIAVRSGHHCAMPLMERYGLSATVRASLGVYNTRAEIDQLFKSIDKVRDLLA